MPTNHNGLYRRLAGVYLPLLGKRRPLGQRCYRIDLEPANGRRGEALGEGLKICVLGAFR